jgi:hypothetical protein
MSFSYLRNIDINYINVTQVAGLEPAMLILKTSVLPLNYTLMDEVGFEPTS